MGALSPWTIERLRAAVATLTVERDEARAAAATLAHAYENDACPPSDVVAQSLTWGRESVLVAVLREALAKADLHRHQFVMLSVPRLARERRVPQPTVRVAPGLVGRVVNEDACGRSVVELLVDDARQYIAKMTEV